MAFSAVAVLNLAVMSNNVAGRTKQVVASSLVFVAWAVGNAIGPQVFRANDKPRYIKAFIAHMVVYGVQVVVLFLLRLYLMRLNALKRRAAALHEASAESDSVSVRSCWTPNSGYVWVCADIALRDRTHASRIVMRSTT